MKTFILFCSMTYIDIPTIQQLYYTENAYTHFVVTTCVITFYVLYLCWKSKIKRHGNSIYIWKDCNREEFYRP